MNKHSKFAFKRIMTIDDNRIDRYLVEINVRKYEFAKEIISKESARSALEFLSSVKTKEEMPELIFLDIRMPEMDGFGFLEEYEKLPEELKEHCIVMILTSSLDSRDQEKAQKNRHVKRFICKPINGEKLKEVTKELLISKVC